MVSPRPQSTAQKKQQSISSFFTAKPSVPATPRSSAITITQRNKEAVESSSLFIHDEENQSPDDVHPPSAAKRTATEKSAASSPPPLKKRRLSSDDDNPSLNQGSAFESLPSAINKAPPPITTDRTSKYIFSSSPGIAQEKKSPEADERDREADRRLKDRLHKKFVEKLGGAGALTAGRRKASLAGQAEVDDDSAEEGQEGESDDDEESRPAPGRYKRGTTRKTSGKLTPLQKEIIELKRKYPDTLLIIEVGYKFQIYGEDARKAAKELSIVCIPGKYRLDEAFDENQSVRFASASFPTHRLQVHAKRLVLAGFKVGIVRQLETAALKAVGSTRNKLFQRGLTNLYTKGTFGIDDEESLDSELASIASAAPNTGYLLCVTESNPKGSGSDEKMQIGLVAVQPATGDIIYDDFEDGWMRSELETRLLHISPCEFLIVGDLSTATKKLITHLSGDGDARVETIEKPKTIAAQSYAQVTRFYADKLKSSDAASFQVESSQQTGTLLDKAHKLSENATICLAAMITHLTDYGLQHVFDLTKYFQSFSSRSHMLLSGDTLASLEIYRNQNDMREYGSLFWTMNRTQTRFGQRLLRKWVGRPLLDRQALEERISAVDELKSSEKSLQRERIEALLRKVKADLERSLIRIYYKRCTRPELLAFLQTLHFIAQEYADVESSTASGFESTQISEAIASLPRILDDVVQYLERINAEAAKANDKTRFFRSEFETEDMKDHEAGIIAVEHDLNEFRKVAAQKLQFKRPVEYQTVAQIDFLIEVDNTLLKKVPASWMKINGTKKVSRYHAPEVLKWIRERDQHKEAFNNACDAAFTDLLTEIASHYQAFRDCIQSLSLLDCLLSLTKVAEQPGYCKPTFSTSPEPGISIVRGRHPMVENLMLNPFVANDAHLHSGGTRALLITGPNMGGKSSYVRSVALIAIMAQIGSYVPADAVELGLLDAVFTRMGAEDNLMKGESTFMVEVGETSDIMKHATSRSLVILDELGRGTSTHDGVAIAQAVLDHMVREKKCLTLFITHYQTLAKMAEGFPDGELKNVHMRFTEHDDDVTFLYEVGEGVAHRSYGLNVAKLAGLPASLLQEASRRSKLMEEVEQRRRVKHLARITREVMGMGNIDGMSALHRLSQGIEQL